MPDILQQEISEAIEEELDMASFSQEENIEESELDGLHAIKEKVTSILST